MPGITTPPVMIEPFALSANPANITNPIPKSTATPGAASYDLGFPPDTMIPVVAGGIPPFGPDFNGILFAITASIAAMQAGQPWQWNNSIVTAIGGYPAGTVLASTDDTSNWLNTLDGNVTDPDGANPSFWVPVSAYGQTTIALSNATVTMSATQGKRPYIVLTGALTANVQVVFPTQFQGWLVINNCTGAHTVTAITAAGTGVVIPAGGAASPTGVYCDGSNIQFSTTPLTVPIDQAPNPATLAERDNLGNLYAVRFNMDEGIETVTGVGGIPVENASLDGFLRLVTPAAFIKLALGSALTVGTGNSWSFSFLGMVIKFGKVTIPGSSTLAVNFAALGLPVFPNVAMIGQISCAQANNGVPYFQAGSLNAAGFICDNSNATTADHYWLVIGN